MASHVAMNNELLTLWLRAGAGLPAEEARELVERLATMEADCDESANEAADTLVLREEECRSEGYRNAHKEIAGRLQTLIEKYGEDDVCQTALWSFHTDLESEARPRSPGRQRGNLPC